MRAVKEAPPQPELPPEKARVRELLDRILELERELEAELHRHQDRVFEDLRLRRVHFEANVRDAQRRARLGVRVWLQQSRPQSMFSIPFIYGMAVPLLFLDLCLTIYQHVCFRLYGISTVARGEFFVIDRHHLAYLNAIEKAHCVYCGYANGVLAYGREIAARTEQYWCPIKHAHRAHGTHARAEHFLAYGDSEGFAAGQERLRHELAEESDDAATVLPQRSIS